MTQANLRPSDCIAAHYKIVLIKIADKLEIKIICDKNGVYVLFCLLYEHHIELAADAAR